MDAFDIRARGLRPAPLGNKAGLARSRRPASPGLEVLEGRRLLTTANAVAFPIPAPESSPVDIAEGPDGLLWLTENSATSGEVVRVASDGSMVGYPTPSGLPVRGIAAGSDGALWFVEAGPPGGSKIGRIAADGRISEFAVPGADNPDRIAAGPDGNLWFTGYRHDGPGPSDTTGIIGRITPQGQATTFPLAGVPGSLPTAIVAGPDGNLWFTDGADRIGRITTGGQVDEFAVPRPNRLLLGIAAGPDGNLWFTEFDAGLIGRITPEGRISEFAMPDAVNPTAIAAGPDGNLWFLADGAGSARLGKISTAGIVTLDGLPASVSSSLRGLAFGPGGMLWFGDAFNNAVVRSDPRAAAVPPAPSPILAGGAPSSSSTGGTAGAPQANPPATVGPVPATTPKPSTLPATPSPGGPVATPVAAPPSGGHGHAKPKPKPRPVTHHRPAISAFAARVAALKQFAIRHGAHLYR